MISMEAFGGVFPLYIETIHAHFRSSSREILSLTQELPPAIIRLATAPLMASRRF